MKTREIILCLLGIALPVLTYSLPRPKHMVMHPHPLRLLLKTHGNSETVDQNSPLRKFLYLPSNATLFDEALDDLKKKNAMKSNLRHSYRGVAKNFCKGLYESGLKSNEKYKFGLTTTKPEYQGLFNDDNQQKGNVMDERMQKVENSIEKVLNEPLKSVKMHKVSSAEIGKLLQDVSLRKNGSKRVPRRVLDEDFAALLENRRFLNLPSKKEYFLDALRTSFTDPNLKMIKEFEEICIAKVDKLLTKEGFIDFEGLLVLMKKLSNYQKKLMKDAAAAEKSVLRSKDDRQVVEEKYAFDDLVAK